MKIKNHFKNIRDYCRNFKNPFAKDKDLNQITIKRKSIKITVTELIQKCNKKAVGLFFISLLKLPVVVEAKDFNNSKPNDAIKQRIDKRIQDINKRIQELDEQEKDVLIRERIYKAVEAFSSHIKIYGYALGRPDTPSIIIFPKKDNTIGKMNEYFPVAIPTRSPKFILYLPFTLIKDEDPSGDSPDSPMVGVVRKRSKSTEPIVSERIRKMLAIGRHATGQYIPEEEGGVEA